MSFKVEGLRQALAGLDGDLEINVLVTTRGSETGAERLIASGVEIVGLEDQVKRGGPRLVVLEGRV